MFFELHFSCLFIAPVSMTQGSLQCMFNNNPVCDFENVLGEICYILSGCL